MNAYCFSRVLEIPGGKVISDGIRQMEAAPGGGYIVTIEDPEGFPVNFVYGQSLDNVEHKKPEKLIFNDETEKPRQKKFQRFKPGPAEVHKVSFRWPLADLRREILTYWYSLAILDFVFRTFQPRWTGIRGISTSFRRTFCTFLWDLPRTTGRKWHSLPTSTEARTWWITIPCS